MHRWRASLPLRSLPTPASLAGSWWPLHPHALHPLLSTALRTTVACASSSRRGEHKKKTEPAPSLAKARSSSQTHLTNSATEKRSGAASPILTQSLKRRPNAPMGRRSSGTRYYAVANGRCTGIFSSWDDCSAQVTGYSGAIFKSFDTRQEAADFVASHSAPAPRRYESEPSYQAERQRTPQRRYEHHRRYDERAFSEDDEPAEQVRHVPSSPQSYSYSPERSEPRVERSPPRSFAAVHYSESSSHTTSRSQHRHRDSLRAQDVYVDGACSQNGRHGATGGYGGYYGDGDSRNFSMSLPDSEPQTNNRGEMRAVLHVIERQLRARDPLPPLRIHTDSRYVLDGLTKYSKKWSKNGFRLSTNEPVKNQDLWERLIRTRDEYNTRYAQEKGTPKQFTVTNTQNDGSEAIELRHVRGHSKIHGNEKADELAVRGAKRPRHS